jgi:E3 ubiquitin-protein ligase RAD18
MYENLFRKYKIPMNDISKFFPRSSWMSNCILCPICKDILTAPLTLPCLHSYCSLCIRLYARKKSTCPTCNAVFEQREMKQNYHLTEIIEYISTLNQKSLATVDKQEEDEISQKPEKTKTICPVCDKMVEIKNMNQHLDSGCKTHIFHPPSQRKPSQAYSMLKDAQLRQLLSKDSISTHGDRKTLIKRHEYWTDVFNANVDSSEPKSLRELKKELIEWENSKSKVSIQISESHLETYKEEYEGLIEQVRKKRKKATPRTSNSCADDEVTIIE